MAQTIRDMINFRNSTYFSNEDKINIYTNSFEVVTDKELLVSCAKK